VRVGLWCIALNLALNVALMHPLQHMGPPLASSLSNWANTIALAAILLHRGHMALTRPLLLDIARMAAAALLMAVALWALQRHAYAPFAAHSTLRWLGLALLVGGGMATYALAATALGILNPAQLLARLRRRKG
jgi:putative peptidoglycan lipid II flippase